jgi:ketose-bisphosphate aldolase
MIAPLLQMIEDARRAGGALAAFTVYDLETAAGVLEAAEEHRGVVLLLPAALVRGAESRFLIPAVVAMAEQAACDVCVQADHLRDRDSVRAALQFGAGAIMADGSRLAWDQNVAYTRWAVAEAEPFGVAVEAALGRIGGAEDDDEAAGEPGSLTDVPAAARFVAETGSDCLAVAIGNVHGSYRVRPRLDWGRLEAIRARVATPLALHGASGLATADLQCAVALGIAKVNVGTALRRAYLDRTFRDLPAALGGARLQVLHRAQRVAVRRLAGALRAELRVSAGVRA